MTESNRRTQGILFDQDGFRITTVGLSVKGQPTLSDWGKALRAATRGKSSIQWAVGDLLNYADGRGWEDGAIEEIMDGTGLKRGTLMNLKKIAKTFPTDRRQTNLPWSHHALVASLHGDEAAAMLTEAAEQAWGWEELREHARTARRQRDRQAQLFPEGTYGLLLAQPPWRSAGGRGLMDPDQIAALAPRVQAITSPHAVLYMHATNLQMEDALRVITAWGFTTRGHHAIVSQIPEHTTDLMRVRHSLLLVATRGRPIGPTAVPDSVIHAETEPVTAMLEQAYVEVPRILLFQREARAGWATWDHSVLVEEPQARAIHVREEEVPA